MWASDTVIASLITQDVQKAKLHRHLFNAKAKIPAIGLNKNNHRELGYY